MKLPELPKPNTKVSTVIGVILALIIGIGAINTVILKTNLFIFKEEMVEAVRTELNPVSYEDMVGIIVQMQNSNLSVIDSLYKVANQGYSRIDTIALKSKIIQYDIKVISASIKRSDSKLDKVLIKLNMRNANADLYAKTDSLQAALNRQLIIEQAKSVIFEQKINRQKIIQSVKDEISKEPRNDNTPDETIKRVKRKRIKKF